VDFVFELYDSESAQNKQTSAVGRDKEADLGLHCSCPMRIEQVLTTLMEMVDVM